MAAGGRTRSARQPGRDNGFTLIEMLVSLALMSLLALMLCAALASATMLVARSRVQSAELDRVIIAQSLLRDRIARMSAVIRLDSAEPVVDVRGTDSELRFHAPPAANAAPATIQRNRLDIDRNGQLVLYTLPELDDRINADAVEVIGWKPFVLLRNVAGMSISYFGEDPYSGDRRWQNRWYDRAQPPDLIRIRIAFHPGDRRFWPDLIIRPRTTSNLVCRIDPRSGRCASTRTQN